MKASSDFTLSRIEIELKEIKETKLPLEPVNKHTTAIRIFKDLIGKHDRETMALLCLGTKGVPTRFQVVHVGSLNQSITHPREIFKAAILSNSHAIIVGHNHPSGNLTPSPQDTKITKQLIQSGKILGIEVYDHIIVSANEGLSMREKKPTLFAAEYRLEEV